MKEEFLVVDNDFAKSNGIDSYVSIFPSKIVMFLFSPQ